MAAGGKESTGREPTLLRWAWLLLIVCGGLALAIMLGRAIDGLVAYSVYDDALMFVRYADNLLHNGVLAWNPGGSPTYGPTSLLYVLVVVPLRLLVPHSPFVTVLAASLLSGVVFLPLTGVLIWRYAGLPNQVAKGLVVVGVLIVLAQAGLTFSRILMTGMDTLFVMAYLAAYLLIGKWHEARRSRASVIALGVCGGLAFAARPDLLLFTLLVPAALVIFAPDAAARRQGA
ncbi:MAG: hypothetical protein JW910_02625, partial [Anaerolineae bacterium]|nr:hypothetical protein [Anaerolineae bacterium]